MQDFIYIKDGVAEEKFSSAQGVEKIKTDQQIFMIAPTLKRLSPGRQIEMHCYDYKSEVSQTLPKYTLHCVDSNEESMVSTPTIAAILVP